jgi:hypothetical protein
MDPSNGGLRGKTPKPANDGNSERTLGYELFEPIWETRNHILHDLPNRYNDALDKSNEEKLQWYYDHRFEVLSFHDRKFAEHSKKKIQAMRGKTKRQWVRKLDRLRAIYEVELQIL